MTSGRQIPYHILTFALVVALILPVLVQDGMFMDGTQYACVSKNLAEGRGTFWFPWLSDTWWKADSPYFMEHPPLVYGIQSLFFRVLGEGMYTERIFSFLTALVTAFLIIKTWRLIYRNHSEGRELSWIPVLLWIVMPLAFWSYQNNIQENTMGIFTLAAVYALLRGLKVRPVSLTWIVISGLCIFLALFCKGVPGVFPVLAAACYYMMHRGISLRITFYASAILFLVPASLISLLLLNEQAYNSLSFYFNERLLQRIAEEPVVESRFYILLRLLLEIAIPAAAVLLFVFYLRWRGYKSQADSRETRLCVFFMLIGLCASLPLMLTTVQRGFYLLPALPFFSIAFALHAAPWVRQLMRRHPESAGANRVLLYTSVFILASAIAVSLLQIGKSSRDREMLEDIHTIGKEIPEGVTVGVSKSLYDAWNFQFYLLRYYDISMTPDDWTLDFQIIEKDKDIQPPPAYIQIPLQTRKYNVYFRGGNSPSSKKYFGMCKL